MITLLALLTLMPYAGLFELEEDNFIQIVDSDTGAHYRVESGVLLLGGDPADLTDLSCLNWKLLV